MKLSIMGGCIRRVKKPAVLRPEPISRRNRPHRPTSQLPDKPTLKHLTYYIVFLLLFSYYLRMRRIFSCAFQGC